MKSDQAAVLLNLCLALIIANIIFLAGADKVVPEVAYSLLKLSQTAFILHKASLIHFVLCLIVFVDQYVSIVFD